MEYQNSRPGVLTEFGYDEPGFTNFIKHSRAGQELSRRSYYRDARDRIVAFQKGSGNAANPQEDGRGDHYWYDAEGQLTYAHYGAADPVANPNNPGRVDQFTYDALGNRKGWNHLASRGWMDFARADNGLNQYHTWGVYPAQYDDDIGGYWGAPAAANGVLMQDGHVTAGYNALKQAVMINTAAMGSEWLFFGYDPLGRCVKRWKGSLDMSAQFPWLPPAEGNPATYFYYEGWNLIREGPNSATTSRYYIHGARVDEIVKQITPGNWWERYFHYDARGHCAFQTDAGGNIVEQYDYDAFGQPYFYDWAGNPLQVYDSASGTWRGYSPWGNRFLFTGREWLSDLKLYDYRHRMYQPELGRFMQPDPKHFEAGDYNLYRYCHNDPVNKSDPFGLEFFDRSVQEVTAIPNEPGLVGLTTPQLELSIQMVPAPGGGFSLQSKVDVRITSKLVATTAHGRPRDPAAVAQTKKHENLHRDVAKKWHDANQNKVPKGPFKTQDAAIKAANDAGNKIKADFNRSQDQDKQHKPDRVWKKMLEKDR